MRWALGHEEQVVGRVYIPYVVENKLSDDEPDSPETIEAMHEITNTPEAESTLPILDASFTITEIPHDANSQAQAKRTIPLRVGSSVVGDHKQERSSPSKQSMGNIGERLALGIEKEQGRIPLRVSHLQGYDAPGCDILSFLTEDAKAAFLSTNESKFIDRFIEAKMSSDGIFELTENEENAAKMWNERYYVYCFCSTSANNEASYDLFVLQAPLNMLEAHVPTTRINATKAKDATKYTIAFSN